MKIVQVFVFRMTNVDRGGDGLYGLDENGKFWRLALTGFGADGKAEPRAVAWAEAQIPTLAVARSRWVALPEYVPPKAP